MKASRLALSLLTAIVFLSGCFDSGKQVSGSNFRRVINQRLAGHPDCWGLTAGNAVDVTYTLNAAFGSGSGAVTLTGPAKPSRARSQSTTRTKSSP